MLYRFFCLGTTIQCQATYVPPPPPPTPFSRYRSAACLLFRLSQPGTIPIAFMHFRTLFPLCAKSVSHLPCNQPFLHSFAKLPGWGTPICSSSKVPYVLPSSVCPKSFVSHSY